MRPRGRRSDSEGEESGSVRERLQDSERDAEDTPIVGAEDSSIEGEETEKRGRGRAARGQRNGEEREDGEERGERKVRGSRAEKSGLTVVPEDIIVDATEDEPVEAPVEEQVAIITRNDEGEN